MKKMQIFLVIILLLTACSTTEAKLASYETAAEEWIESNPVTNDGRDGWSDNAKIKEMVPVYNEEDVVVNYIALVEENGEDRGYITFENQNGTLEVPQFSTEGTFYLFSSKYYEPDKNLKIVGDTPYGFAFKTETGEIIHPETGEIIQ